MRIAYFDCVSGVSGDMTLAALVSAGWPRAELEALPARLKLEGVRIDVREVRRGPFAALQVEVHGPSNPPHRHLRHVEAILADADLAGPVRERAVSAFRRLAEAEAAVHGSTPEKVHFHEVGAVDAIVDIAGAMAGLAALGVERVFASALPLGGGTVMSEHGRIPVPAPATAQLLRGALVRMGPVEAELVTPTGAAILATLVDGWSEPPPYRIHAIGTGAGARDFPDHPNVLRLVLGEASTIEQAGRPIAVLETAVDDENPQFLAELPPRLIAEGALDAMLLPTVMKKGRAGTLLVVLCEPSDAERFASRMLVSTSTLGVRVRTERRLELPRRAERVTTGFGEVELKVATLPEGGERAIPEFESVRRVAESSGSSLREVSEAAIQAWAEAKRTAPGARKPVP